MKAHGVVRQSAKNNLNSIPDDCLRENTFKSDVQAALLRIIHKLLVKRMFVLLEPTVHIWSIDVVNAAILELGDKKVTNILGPVFLS